MISYIKLSLFPGVKGVHDLSGEADDELFDDLHVLF